MDIMQRAGHYGGEAEARDSNQQGSVAYGWQTKGQAKPYGPTAGGICTWGAMSKFPAAARRQKEKLPWSRQWETGSAVQPTQEQVPLTASLGVAVGRGVLLWALGASWCRGAFHGADATSWQRSDRERSRVEELDWNWTGAGAGAGVGAAALDYWSLGPKATEVAR
ncbi:hypothetical protein BKA81DRAFT_376738 [Phyllosticta paracitricarpa]